MGHAGNGTITSGKAKNVTWVLGCTAVWYPCMGLLLPSERHTEGKQEGPFLQYFKKASVD